MMAAANYAPLSSRVELSAALNPVPLFSLRTDRVFERAEAPQAHGVFAGYMPFCSDCVVSALNRVKCAVVVVLALRP